MRIINTSTRPIGLRGTEISLDLPRGGFADISDEELADLRGNAIVRIFEEKRLISITDGPAKGNLALASRTSDKEKPVEYQPVSDQRAAVGRLEADETVVEPITSTAGQGEQVQQARQVKAGKVK